MAKTMKVEAMMQVLAIDADSSSRGRYTDKELKRLRKVAMEEGLFFIKDLWLHLDNDPFSAERKQIEETRKWWREKIAAGKSGEVIDKAEAEVPGSQVETTGGGCMAGLLNVAPGIICSWTDDCFGVTVSRVPKLDGWELFYSSGDEEKVDEESEWANHPEAR